MTNPHRSRTLRRTALTVLLLVALAACGGTDDAADDGVASLTGSDAPDADAAGDPSAGPTDPEEAMLAFAECMREHGIDVPDPQVDGEGRSVVTAEGPGEGGAVDREQMDEANEACRPLMEGAIADGPAREIDPEVRQQLLDFAECMRGEGLDWPDPTFEGGAVTQRSAPQDPDAPEDSMDEIEAAMEVCEGESDLAPPAPAAEAQQ